MAGWPVPSAPLPWARPVQVLQEMRALGIAPDVVGYSTVMNMWSDAGMPRQAEDVLQEMESRGGIAPDVAAFTVLAKAYLEGARRPWCGARAAAHAREGAGARTRSPTPLLSGAQECCPPFRQCVVLAFFDGSRKQQTEEPCSSILKS